MGKWSVNREATIRLLKLGSYFFPSLRASWRNHAIGDFISKEHRDRDFRETKTLRILADNETDRAVLRRVTAGYPTVASLRLQLESLSVFHSRPCRFYRILVRASLSYFLQLWRY